MFSIIFTERAQSLFHLCVSCSHPAIPAIRRINSGLLVNFMNMNISCSVIKNVKSSFEPIAVNISQGLCFTAQAQGAECVIFYR